MSSLLQLVWLEVAKRLIQGDHLVYCFFASLVPLRFEDDY